MACNYTNYKYLLLLEYQSLSKKRRLNDMPRQCNARSNADWTHLRSYCLGRQRAFAAFRALALRLTGDIFAALAGPPFFPPCRPAAWALASFLGAISGGRSAAASGSSLSSRLSNTRLAKRLGSLVGFRPMLLSLARTD